MELWIPKQSDFYKHYRWLEENYPSTTHASVVVMSTEEDTILTADNVRKLFQIHHEIGNLNSSKNGITWKQICWYWPNVLKKPACAENSLLEIWAKGGSYKDTNQTLWQKTDQQILEDINSIRVSGIFGFPANLKLYLGSMETNNSKVTKAKAFQLVLQANLDQENLQESKKRAYEFEEEFIALMENLASENKDGPININYICQKSIKNIYNGSINSDLNLLSAGFVIVFVYVILMLGKFNSLEQRGYLSLFGLVAVVLGTFTSNGIGQLMGIFSSPMNSILTFMLLGIGIDDMFVVVQGLTNVQRDVATSRYSSINLLLICGIKNKFTRIISE